jgi:hypothetical protein
MYMSLRVAIGTGESGKGRSFEFELLCYVECERLQPTSGNTHRPFFAVLAMSDAVVSPVRANLLTGREFGQPNSYGHKRTGEWFEFLKSHRWAWEPQKVAEGTLVTIYRPDLMLPDPGFVDPNTIRFGVLIDHGWLAASATHDPLTPEMRNRLQTVKADVVKNIGGCSLDFDELVQHAPLICAYLDRRTRVPLVPDRVFQVMLCLKLLRHRALNELRGYRGDLQDVGMAAAYSLVCSQAAFETLAADVLHAYYSSKS